MSFPAIYHLFRGKQLPPGRNSAQIYGLLQEQFPQKPIDSDMARPRKAVDTSTYTGRFAVRLKTLRERAGFTVEELAEVTGIPKPTLYHWEIAHTTPSFEQLPILAKALQIRVRTLLPEA